MAVMTNLNPQSNESNQRKVSNQVTLAFKIFMTGSVASIICSFLLQPLDVIKTRLQTPEYKKPLKRGRSKFNIINMIYEIKEKESLKMLWAGMTPTLVRGIPAGGIYFMSYDIIRSHLFSEGHISTLESIIIGMMSRTVTDISVIPLTVVKTRMESGVYRYPGIWAGLKIIYSQEGFRGLTSGLLPILVRDVPMSGIHLMFYIQSEELVPRAWRDTHPSLVHSSCAALAGMVASSLTHPPDVVKAHLQLSSSQRRTTWQAVADIWKEHGIYGYFQGLVPRLLKRTIFGMISWTLYEKVKQMHFESMSKEK
ncbi:unnamed protein product [Diabrotica balteata]|uniref:Mitochondrial glycine transporter n=1 Tax=Diabrotica balteata TaxID=107213 RepID=A0A9N9TD96_DIABA|nr:unnamed protein product [Diabrotica balteata]